MTRPRRRATITVHANAGTPQLRSSRRPSCRCGRGRRIRRSTWRRSVRRPWRAGGALVHGWPRRRPVRSRVLLLAAARDGTAPGASARPAPKPRRRLHHDRRRARRALDGSVARRRVDGAADRRHRRDRVERRAATCRRRERAWVLGAARIEPTRRCRGRQARPDPGHRWCGFDRARAGAGRSPRRRLARAAGGGVRHRDHDLRGGPGARSLAGEGGAGRRRGTSPADPFRGTGGDGCPPPRFGAADAGIDPAERRRSASHGDARPAPGARAARVAVRHGGRRCGADARRRDQVDGPRDRRPLRHPYRDRGRR